MALFFYVQFLYWRYHFGIQFPEIFDIMNHQWIASWIKHWHTVWTVNEMHPKWNMKQCTQDIDKIHFFIPTETASSAIRYYMQFAICLPCAWKVNLQKRSVSLPSQASCGQKVEHYSIGKASASIAKRRGQSYTLRSQPNQGSLQKKQHLRCQ